MTNRHQPRTRTLLEARVVFNDRFSLIECTVRDLSDSGAQIAFAHPVTLPSQLELEIPKKGISTRARVAWSNGKTHGLTFISAADEKASSTFPALLAEPESPEMSSPQDASITSSALNIQNVLAEARNHIAQIAGVPADKIRLKLEIDQ
ncbi:PilZ domain-containing protein [Microvirga brassicacearum]|uniref:PilZ domain-containing protein n=1 Tax=Microvirga brassicacearum TaxID=2580413 RepID=A0A5N3P7U4_9HYPH|nr:PilZ domain-containing protein [Microvirga brassicacearum]KAB0265755.1 PilZ domain-containing protein [Microvirga brassicacearum]